MDELVEYLEGRGELAVVEREVDPKFELAAVAVALQKRNENAVLFRKVGGSDFPVVANVYGSHRRLCDMIGAGDRSFVERWLELTEGRQSNPAPPAASAPEPHVECKLGDLPQITYHARDGAPYFTSAIYLAKDPDTGTPNLSFHRSMYVSDEELRVRLGSTHDLASYQARAEARGEPLEAALILGASPALFLAACASLPIDDSEIDLAGRIAGRALEMRRCHSIDLEVPVDASIVVEGRFLPNVKRPEGPFGEFMGNYVEVGDNHVFEVTAVTHRPGAVFNALVCGSTDDLRPLEAVTAARIYRHLKNTVRGVLDVSCRPNVMITIVRIRKQYEGHGKHVLLAALGSYLDYNKVVIVVDEDVDPHNLEDVMWAYLTRGRADTRAMILNDIPGFYRDPMKDHWGRLAIDATMPWGREAEFARKHVPGADEIDLSQYLA
ncbi:MAG: UbiD family decarboxylase [Candidatus Andeanibacterium colombiense]|uniref:UbiD family decarboxylase n=1 Tax=Candidatus Andeanibacterium colombiense TaxID=3121345 RepID=A0AAJ6BNY4_9SPHN|nr:MAG: UbiD family decarboxylase [Sphingomonadaceae bacterium]